MWIINLYIIFKLGDILNSFLAYIKSKKLTQNYNQDYLQVSMYGV